MTIFSNLNNAADIAMALKSLSDRVADLEARLPNPKVRYVIKAGRDHLWLSGNVVRALTRDDADSLVRILIRSGFEDADFWPEAVNDGE